MPLFMPWLLNAILKNLSLNVGVGHLAGESGLIDLLKAKGYSVSPVLE